MRRLVLLAFAALLLPLPAARADSPPSPSTAFPACSSIHTTNCITSFTRNGGTDAGFAGVDAYLTDAHRLDWSVRDIVGHAPCPTSSGVSVFLCKYNLVHGDHYDLVINTGAFHPAYTAVTGDNVEVIVTGDATTGYLWHITADPIVWGEAGSAPCNPTAGCGDATRSDDHTYTGFLQGVGQDLLDMSASDQRRYNGVFEAGNVWNHTLPSFNVGTGIISLPFANPHLRHDGTPVTDGTYQARITNRTLIEFLGVPDPSALSSVAFTATRTDGTVATTIPVTITHVTGGIELRLTGIHFSNPKIKIKVTSRPARPTRTRARRFGTTALVSFTAGPNGHLPTTYTASCTSGHQKASRTGTRSPLTVPGISYGRTWKCAVTARNKRGRFIGVVTLVK